MQNGRRGSERDEWVALDRSDTLQMQCPVPILAPCPMHGQQLAPAPGQAPVLHFWLENAGGGAGAAIAAACSTGACSSAPADRPGGVVRWSAGGSPASPRSCDPCAWPDTAAYACSIRGSPDPRCPVSVWFRFVLAPRCWTGTRCWSLRWLAWSPTALRPQDRWVPFPAVPSSAAVRCQRHASAWQAIGSCRMRLPLGRSMRRSGCSRCCCWWCCCCAPPRPPARWAASSGTPPLALRRASGWAAPWCSPPPSLRPSSAFRWHCSTWCVLRPAAGL